MPDYTIRQLLRSQSYAARKTGLIAETYQTNPAGLAALALDASKGDVKAAQAMLITAGLYLVHVESEDKLPIVASPPLAANDDHENAEGDDR